MNILLTNTRKSITNLLILLIVSTFFACVPYHSKYTYIKGTAAKTVISENFNFRKGMRIAVMPFVESGKDKNGISPLASDKFSAKLMEMGFIVVERSALMAIFKELKLNYTGVLSDKDRKSIGKLLNIDLLVFGTLTYSFIPASYSSQPQLRFIVQENASPPGQITNSRGAYYALGAESIRVIKIETGEIMIMSNVNVGDTQNHSMSEEMAESIKYKLNNLFE